MFNTISSIGAHDTLISNIDLTSYKTASERPRMFNEDFRKYNNFPNEIISIGAQDTRLSSPEPKITTNGVCIGYVPPPVAYSFGLSSNTRVGSVCQCFDILPHEMLRTNYPRADKNAVTFMIDAKRDGMYCNDCKGYHYLYDIVKPKYHHLLDEVLHSNLTS